MHLAKLTHSVALHYPMTSKTLTILSLVVELDTHTSVPLTLHTFDTWRLEERPRILMNKKMSMTVVIAATLHWECHSGKAVGR